MCYHSGLADRRGFDGCMQVCLLCTMVSIGIAVVLHLWISVYACIFFGLVYNTLRQVSNPPRNDPAAFDRFVQCNKAIRRQPTLVCLGDSLTHGTISGPVTTRISEKVRMALKLEDKERPPVDNLLVFREPIWVINCAQNGITSETILVERLHRAISYSPEFIFLWIGTNDVRAMYRPTKSKGTSWTSWSSWQAQIMQVNSLNETPSLTMLEKNLAQILSEMQRVLPMSAVGVATLPPMGEIRNTTANEWIRKANAIIYKVVAAQDHDKCTVIPVYERLMQTLMNDNPTSSLLVPIDWFFPVSAIQCFLFYSFPGVFSWRSLSANIFGHTIMSDGLHLHETGSEIVVDLIVEWLIKQDVSKVIQATGRILKLD
jgi:lysophospholipase L1-like esterase